jgi:cell division protein FtsL
MNNSGSFGLNQNLTKFRSGRKMGPITNAVLIIVIVAMLGILYLTQLTKTGSFSYQLNSIDQQKTALTAEQDNLQVENARLRSLSTISSSQVAASMTTPASVSSAQ